MIVSRESLPALLRAVVAGDASPGDINLLVRQSHRMAVVRLRQMVHSGKLHLQSFPLTIDAIAFDCIAELFARDENGHFIDLENYFSDERDLNMLGENQILHFFRALLFRVMQDGIFRLYQENDPILAKILRNTKLVLKQLPEIKQFDQFGIPLLSTCMKDQIDQNLPEMPIEAMVELGSRVPQSVTMKEFIRTFFNLLGGEDEYRKSVSLFDLAVAVKRIGALRKIPLDELILQDPVEMHLDVEKIIEESLGAAKIRLHDRYVGKEKVAEDEFCCYFDAIREIVYDTFVLNDGQAKSLDEHLGKYFPGMTYDLYRSKYRTRFEYMVRISKNLVKQNLKELI